MYRKNSVLKKMIVEHMSVKSQSPVVKTKPKKNYHNSSMEFSDENNEFKGGEAYNQLSKFNGNVTSLRSSAGNITTYHSSQTPVSQRNKNRESSASKMNYSSNPFTSRNESVNRIASTNKLSIKEIIDEPIWNESFDDTFMDMDNSSMSIGEYGEIPTLHEETLYRSINFSNQKLVLNSDLDEFMDKQLQVVAERLADKRSLEKYNMMLRLKMKDAMGDMQEMLDDSEDIRARIVKEERTKNKLAECSEDIEFELHEIRYKVQELRNVHVKKVKDWEEDKNELYWSLSNARDEFIIK
jgi:hypothetical protein